MKNILLKVLYLLIIPIFNSCGTDSEIVEEEIPSANNIIEFVRSGQTLGNTTSFGLAVGDVDLDGDLDVFVANYTGTSLLWINDGSGNFTQHNQTFGSIQSATHDAEIGDLNGDSYPEIIMANHNTPGKIYFNSGGGYFNEGQQEFGGTSENPQTVQIADVDLDGDNDVYFYNISGANRLWINIGNGSLTMDETDYAGDNSNGQVLADFNGDLYPDLYCSMRNAPSQIWLNNGTGRIINSGYTFGHGGEAICCGDIDNDGDNDIVELSYSQITVWLNQNNSATFAEGFNFNEGGLDGAFLDTDLDGDLDLVTGHLELGNKLWLNDESGNFTVTETPLESSRILGVICADLNGDNYPDIIFGKETGSGGNTIYFNNCGN